MKNDGKSRLKNNNNRQKHSPILTLGLLVLMAAGGYVIKYFNDHINATESQWHTEYITGTDLTHPATNPTLAEQLIEYKAMTVSFNKDMHIPNWVSWELLRSEVDGNEERGDKFLHDDNVIGCPYPEDYRGSGYDRGHMAPAADMRWCPEAMRQSFYMTNICPQLHSLNGGTWKKLEEKCRIWAMADSAIIIIAGPILTDLPDEYIGNTGVAVPKRYFKIIAAPFANPPRGIGFIMPNGRVAGGMQAAAVSIDSVERVTGHDFFQNLPDSIQHIIESKCRFNFWSNIKP